MRPSLSLLCRAHPSASLLSRARRPPTRESAPPNRLTSARPRLLTHVSADRRSPSLSLSLSTAVRVTPRAPLRLSPRLYASLSLRAPLHLSYVPRLLSLSRAPPFFTGRLSLSLGRAKTTRRIGLDNIAEPLARWYTRPHFIYSIVSKFSDPFVRLNL